jgi:hypothetical protein
MPLTAVDPDPELMADLLFLIIIFFQYHEHLYR